MDRYCDKSEAEKLAMVLQELKPKPINNTNVNDMEIEIAHEYEQTPGIIEESETHDSDTDSILSKETAILEAGDIDESIMPESVVFKISFMSCNTRSCTSVATGNCVGTWKCSISLSFFN